MVHVDAPVSAVWRILTEPSYISKLYPDAITVEVDRPGPARVGQSYKIIGKAGRRRLEILVQVAEVTPERTIVTKNRPGGLFGAFEQTIHLEPTPGGSTVRLKYDYEVSWGYIGKALNSVLIERLVRDNVAAYGQNLKQIAELLPMPAESKS